MRENEHRKQKNGNVCQKNEFVLVDRRAFLVSVKKESINFITKQLENVGRDQHRQKEADVGDKRPFGNRLGNERATKHGQPCCNGD